MLKHSPESPGIRKNRRDFVCQVSSAIEIEVSGSLAGEITRYELIENVRAEQPALYSDGWKGRHA
jgi:hypothetical protein